MGLLGSNHSKEQMIVAGRINAAGDVVTGSGFSCVDGATGIYTVTFDRAYDTLISVVAQSELTDVVMIATTVTHTDGTDGPSILFTGEAIADTPADADCGFSFITIWETDT